jgi:hypothetical protein
MRDAGGLPWAVIVVLLASLLIGAVAIVVELTTGETQVHVRRGAGTDRTTSLPIARCVDAPKQAIDGVRAILQPGTKVDALVALRKSGFDVLVAGRVTHPPEELTRMGIRRGSAVWRFSSGIAADAHPTELISRTISRPESRVLTIDPEDVRLLSECLERRS